MTIYLPAMAGISLAIAGMLIPDDAWGMRCGTRIVSKGDIQAKVLRFCGEPETVSTRFAERGGYLPRYRHDDRYLIRYSDNGRYFRTEVIIEEWVYNLGANKLMRRITFENGVVRKVETLGRGYR